MYCIELMSFLYEILISLGHNHTRMPVFHMSFQIIIKRDSIWTGWTLEGFFTSVHEKVAFHIWQTHEWFGTVRTAITILWLSEDGIFLGSFTSTWMRAQWYDRWHTKLQMIIWIKIVIQKYYWIIEKGKWW